MRKTGWVGLLLAPLCLAASGVSAAPPQETQQREKDAVLRYYDEVWNKMSLNVANELFAASYDVETLKDVIAKMHFGVPNIKMKVDEIFAAEDDRVVVLFTATGTHEGEVFGAPASGKHVEYSGIEVFRFKDGKIFEKENTIDRYRFMDQIGALCAQQKK